MQKRNANYLRVLSFQLIIKKKSVENFFIIYPNSENF